MRTRTLLRQRGFRQLARASTTSVSALVIRRGSYSPASFKSVISMQMKRGRALQAGISAPGILARLIEFQNTPGRLDVKPAKLPFQVIQVLCGDAVIFCAE